MPRHAASPYYNGIVLGTEAGRPQDLADIEQWKHGMKNDDPDE